MSQPELKIEKDGTKHWYLNGKLHREDGPAVENPDGIKLWYLKGELHREDSPAVEYANGGKRWYLNDKLHREDGPAVEYANGEKRWYLNGKSVSWKQVFKNAKTQEQELNIIIHALG